MAPSARGCVISHTSGNIEWGRKLLLHFQHNIVHSDGPCIKRHILPYGAGERKHRVAGNQRQYANHEPEQRQFAGGDVCAGKFHADNGLLRSRRKLADTTILYASFYGCADESGQHLHHRLAGLLRCDNETASDGY